MITLTLTEEDAHDLSLSIGCRLGIIETGISMVRACDVAATGNSNFNNYKIKALDRDQRDLINRLEDIQFKLRGQK